MPFLSVIIPVYNAEKFLDDCFNSIKRQTFGNYEVIIVDDGSKDTSPQICDEYALNDQRVTVYHVENGGPSRARNIGFQNASGEYIFCIDNDDYISGCDYFERIYSSLKNKPVDVLQTGATYIRDDTGKVNRKINYSNAPNIDINSPSEFVYWLISNKLYETSCWTKIVNRDFLISNNYYFDTDLIVEDLDWNMRLLQGVRSYNILRSADYIHVYRGGSITTGQGEKGYKICLDQIATIKKWALYFQSYVGNKKLKDCLLSYLSYQFFITLGKASTLDDEWKNRIQGPLKEIDFVSKYAIEKKQKLLSVLYHIFGYGFTSKIVSFYYNKMRTRAR